MQILLELGHSLGELARSMGLVGLFALTLFDGSLLWLLPGINDLVLISFVIAKHSIGWAVLAVLVATCGSILGAMASYRIGHRGGADLLRKRFPPKLLVRVDNWTHRLGAIPVGVAAVMPPPFPYAPFVFSAGVMKVPPARFRFSVGLGRGVRYSLEAVLAMYIGRHLLRQLNSIYWAALEPGLILIAVALLVWGIYRLQFSHRDSGPTRWLQ
ncbi:MAG: YqaA family protein [Terriglobales bacterium]